MPTPSYSVCRHPGGTKLCILCKLDDNQLNCQGILKWYSVKSKRGPGRPKDKGQPKTPRTIAAFLTGVLEVASAPKVITLKSEPGTHLAGAHMAGAHVEPIKIKIEMRGDTCLPNGNGFLDPDLADSPGFYIHVECCRWTTSVNAELEMFRAERFLLKGLGQVTISYYYICTCNFILSKYLHDDSWHQFPPEVFDSILDKYLDKYLMIPFYLFKV